MRHKWIDISRGILIILVVFGHSAFIQYYSYWHSIIYWFHMPAFFFLSGYVFKSKDSFGQQAKQITKKLLIPYVIILVAITCYRYLFTPMSADVLGELKSIVLGGRYVEGYYAPFWFITCLWATQIIFSGLLKLPRSLMWLVVVSLFVLSHFEPASWKIPENLDMSFYAILFFALGNKAKWITNWYCCTIGTAIFVIAFLLVRNGTILFSLDMKQHVLNGKFDLIIPLCGTLMAIGISKMIEHIALGEVLAPIGKDSLMIMYLHLIATIEMYRLGVYRDILLFVVIGIVVPMLIHSLTTAIKSLLLLRFSYTRKAMLDRA